jgi:hypothetical protein
VKPERPASSLPYLYQPSLPSLASTASGLSGSGMFSKRHNLVCYWARTVGSRFRVWQGLDCRPQLIDQHSAVVPFPLPLDAGQSIPRTIGRLPLNRGEDSRLVRSHLFRRAAQGGNAGKMTATRGLATDAGRKALVGQRRRSSTSARASALPQQADRSASSSYRLLGANSRHPPNLP